MLLKLIIWGMMIQINSKVRIQCKCCSCRMYITVCLNVEHERNKALHDDDWGEVKAI